VDQPPSRAQRPRRLAPIAFFAFRRPATTQQALTSLSRCPGAAQSDLHVFSDGPRGPADVEAVAQVREIVRAQRWCSRLELHEAEQNRGLARSVIDGVGALCASHGRVIVLEDDLLVSSGFLAYINRGLDEYQDAQPVLQISGHSFPFAPPEPRAVLLPLATTWGWATWARAWALFEERPDLAPLRDPAVRRAFDLDGAYPYSRMLERQLAGELDSWGVRWWWQVHRHGGLGLFPLRTLVRNVGVGDLATHTRWESALTDSPEWHADAGVDQFPARLEVDQELLRRWQQCVRDRRPGLAARARALARSLFARSPPRTR
jgi:hypothetical protein